MMRFLLKVTVTIVLILLIFGIYHRGDVFWHQSYLSTTPKIVNILPSSYVSQGVTPAIIYKNVTTLDNLISMNETDKEETKLEVNSKQIILYTSYRCGSSFTGELFKQNNEIYYLFEPGKLTSLETGQARDKEAYKYTQEHMTEYIRKGMNCTYRDLYADSRRLFPQSHQLRRKWLRRIFEQPLRMANTTSFSFRTVAGICQKKHIRVMKILRASSLRILMPLMEQKMSIINLIRHPIGMALSRLNVDAARKHIALEDYLQVEENIKVLEYNVLQICKKYVRDTEFILREGKANYSKLLTETYRLIRYEDVARETKLWTRALYEFLKINWSEKVEKWIDISTKKDPKIKDQANRFGSIYTTKRNSSEHIDKWRTEIPYNLAIKLDTACRDNGRSVVLDMLGYRQIGPKDEYADMTKSQITDIDSTMPFLFNIDL